jgi:hypothetical protein
LLLKIPELRTIGFTGFWKRSCWLC